MGIIHHQTQWQFWVHEDIWSSSPSYHGKLPCCVVDLQYSSYSNSHCSKLQRHCPIALALRLHLVLKNETGVPLPMPLHFFPPEPIPTKKALLFCQAVEGLNGSDSRYKSLQVVGIHV